MQSDNGFEFQTNPMFNFTLKMEFFTKLIVLTPLIEQKSGGTHCHILNVTRALRFQLHLPKDFWGDCVLTATHLIYRAPSKLFNGQTPCEALYGVSPNFNEINVFGVFALLI